MTAGFLKSIFRPHDGTRQKVQEEVVTSREKVETAVDRFEDTIRELIDRNDELTGRNHAQPRSQ